jgi:hypothetical protein
MDDAPAPLVQGQKPRRLAARTHPQATPGLIRMRANGAFADLQNARHLLGLQVLGDQSQNFALPL